MQLKEFVRSSWDNCPKALRIGLLPEAAVEHASKTLGVDNRLRIWQDPENPRGLLYTCHQAQIQWGSGNPVGMPPFLKQQPQPRPPPPPPPKFVCSPSTMLYHPTDSLYIRLQAAAMQSPCVLPCCCLHPSVVLGIRHMNALTMG